MLKTLSIQLEKPIMLLTKGFLVWISGLILSFRAPLGRSVDRSYKWPEEIIKSQKAYSFGVPIVQSNRFFFRGFQ